MGTSQRLGFGTRVGIGCALGAILAVCGLAACGLDAVGRARTNNPLLPEGGGEDADVFVPPEAGEDGEAGPIDAGPCGWSTKGPSMVFAADAASCIDSTEVTNADYDLFLTATGGGKIDAGLPEGGPAPLCLPPLFSTYNRAGPSGGPTQPVARITWCSAEAYCRWAGKRLCRGTHGQFTSGEWYAICSQRGRYPYGASYVAGACNDTSGATEPVGTRTGCEGGVPGVFDMTGNVFEFINACTAGFDSCQSMGGGFAGGASNDCTQGGYYAPKSSEAANTGVRCCADPR